MTNAEKFKEVFGYEINHYSNSICTLTTIECPNKNLPIDPCNHCEYNNGWWDKEYKAPKKKCCCECKYCKPSDSIFEVGVGWCQNKDSNNHNCRVSLWACECDNYEERQ